MAGPDGPQGPDPLLDPPERAPDWLPSVDREPSLRWLRWGIVAVLAVGLVAFVARGADNPADPVLGPAEEAGPEPTDPPPLTVPGAGSGGEDTGGLLDDDPVPAVLQPPPGLGLPGDPDRVPFGDFAEVALSVTTPDGELLSWCLLAAIEAAQRQRGLMEVTDLQGYSGMAFVFEDDVSNAFFMRNTPMPLTIAWIDAEGQLVGSTDMEPCPDQDGCPTFPPPAPYRVAIEVPQGGLADLGIEPGADVRLGGSCTPRTG